MGMEAHSHGSQYAYDRAKQATRIESDRPIALREAIEACRNGGTISVPGAYSGFIDKFPMGSMMNRGQTLRTGQCHVHRYVKPLYERVLRGEVDPSFVFTHVLPLDEAQRLRHVRPQEGQLRERRAQGVTARARPALAAPVEALMARARQCLMAARVGTERLLPRGPTRP
jgi:hypothetical protein